MSNFDDHHARTFVPSDLICVDESMSKCYGAGGHWINIGLLNYIAMDRKPENGCEIQNSADGWAWVMLHLKLLKNVEDEYAHLAAFHNDGLCLAHGTQVALYLLQPWEGAYPPRVVCADSYFSCLSTLDAWNANGLKHTGVIKTATRKFPAA